MMADICLEVHRVINNSPQYACVVGHEVKIFIEHEIITCSLGCERWYSIIFSLKKDIQSSCLLQLSHLAVLLIWTLTDMLQSSANNEVVNSKKRNQSNTCGTGQRPEPDSFHRHFKYKIPINRWKKIMSHAEWQQQMSFWYFPRWYRESNAFKTFLSCIRSYLKTILLALTTRADSGIVSFNGLTKNEQNARMSSIWG